MENASSRPPRPSPPQVGQRRAELIRQRQAEEQRAATAPAARGCGGCRGRKINR